MFCLIRLHWFRAFDGGWGDVKPNRNHKHVCIQCSAALRKRKLGSRSSGCLAASHVVRLLPRETTLVSCIHYFQTVSVFILKSGCFLFSFLFFKSVRTEKHHPSVSFGESQRRRHELKCA